MSGLKKSCAKCRQVWVKCETNTEEGLQKMCSPGAAENTEPVMLCDQLHATAFCTQRNILYQSEWGLGGPTSLLQKKKIVSTRFPGSKSRFITGYNFKQ